MAKDFTSGSQWRRVRLQVLERDGYHCQIKGPKCDGKATDVDHIIPVPDGGAVYDKTNLRRPSPLQLLAGEPEQGQPRLAVLEDLHHSRGRCGGLSVCCINLLSKVTK